jgi:uncharacterized protein (TIGR00290 family)
MITNTVPISDAALCSWSGGKDSCLALHLAQSSGFNITTLVSVFEEAEDRNRSHAMPLRLIEAQAKVMNLKLVTPRASWQNYEAQFVATLKQCKQDTITTAVFGDIDLVPHREWEEKVCTTAGLKAVLPLWDWPRDKVVDAVFELGIKAVCVCVNTSFLLKEFCGREYNRQFIADLPAGVDACGENGEFHTFVTFAPLFRNAIDVRNYGARHYIGPVEYGSQEFFFADLR